MDVHSEDCQSVVDLEPVPCVWIGSILDSALVPPPVSLLYSLCHFDSVVMQQDLVASLHEEIENFTEDPPCTGHLGPVSLELLLSSLLRHYLCELLSFGS